MTATIRSCQAHRYGTHTMYRSFPGVVRVILYARGYPNFGNHPIFLEQFAKVQQGFGPAKRRVRENCSLEWSRNGHRFFWAIHLLPIALRRLPQLTVALLQGTAMGAAWQPISARWTHDHNGWDVIGCKDQPLRFHY